MSEKRKAKLRPMGEVQHLPRCEYRCGSETFLVEMYVALDLKDPPSIQPIKKKRPKSSYTLTKTFSERKYQTVNRQKVVTYEGKEPNLLATSFQQCRMPEGGTSQLLGNHSSLHASLQASSQQKSRRFQMSKDSESPFLASDLGILSRKIKEIKKEDGKG